MPWKNEIDRIVHQLALDAAHGGENEARRAVQTVADLLTLCEGREASHFHAGVVQEVLAGKGEAEEKLLTDLLPAAEGEAIHWRHVGRLDAASRRGSPERVRELMDDPLFEAGLTHPEGRMALRAVSRLLLRDGDDVRAFELYRRHLEAVDDEGGRRDAEFLLEEALRRADRGDTTEDETLMRLERAAAFAEAGNLDARARSKVERKLGRVHQLLERWDEAAACYRRALDRLPPEDPYRSVLVGDLALAMLQVRGTLDLLPRPGREGAEAAEKVLEEGETGEGRSYNAIYTLGVLAYERGDHERAAKCFREADQLMQDNRAKARIVHARARFFLGHCLLMLGAEGESLEEAARLIRRDQNAVSMAPELKEAVLADLAERMPEAPRQARGGRSGRGGGRGGRPPQAPGEAAARYLEEARAALAEDPHAALDLIDRAFKSRPEFDTWFGAYVTRLEALLRLAEGVEARRTFDRFRSKLYQREALDRLDGLLADRDGPVSRLLDETALDEERIDLYEVMPGKEDAFVERCIACARNHLGSGETARLARAVALLGEAKARRPDSVEGLLEEAIEAARVGGVVEEVLGLEEARALLAPEEEPVRIIVIGGDEGRRPHRDQLERLAKELGFEAAWIYTGARPPYKTMREIEDAAQDADALLLHHSVAADLRDELRQLSKRIEIPLREATWLGAHGLEREVLGSIRDAFVD